MTPNSIGIEFVWLIITAVASSTFTAAGFIYRLKGRIAITENCMKTLEKKHHEDHKIVLTKFDDLEKDYKDLKTDVDNKIEKVDDKIEKIFGKIDGLKDHINNSHLKLLEAINSNR
jgi:predicted  nucleic acid-binding Zn-ribbon protein